MYGLLPADVSLIQREYDAKRTRVPTAPAATGAPAADAAAPAAPVPLTANDEPWADGIRRLEDGTPSENYSSSTVYEYFAQTGCAYQGTNAGTDPYTSRPRNNGQSWVSTHEPALAGLLSRVCSHTELRNVNPRDQRAREAAAAAAASGGSAAAAAAAAASSETAAAPAPAVTPGPTSAPTSAPTSSATPAPKTVGDVAPPNAAVGAGAVGVLRPA
jgi:hypothetical protein